MDRASTGKHRTALSVAAAIGLLAVMAGTAWWWMQRVAATAATKVRRPALTAQAQEERCCTVPGPWNYGRTEDAGPSDAPVHLVALTGNCYDQKLACDLLLELSREYPEHLQVTVRSYESETAEEWGTECATYLVRAQDYVPAGGREYRDGYYILFEKSPEKGGWNIWDLERSVRAAIEACGGEPHDMGLADKLNVPPAIGDPPPGMFD